VAGSLAIRNGHADGVIGLDDRRPPQQQAPQPLGRRREYRSECQVAVDDILAEQPFPIANEPKRQAQIGCADRPRPDVPDIHLRPKILRDQFGWRRDRRDDRHFVTVFDSRIGKVDDDALGSPLGERRNDMDNPHPALCGLSAARRPHAIQNGSLALNSIRSSPAASIIFRMSEVEKRCSRRVPMRSRASVRRL